MNDRPPVYHFDRFRVDPETRQVSDETGASLPIAGRAYDVLVHLLQHRDRVVGKDELLAAVWPRVVVEENNLSQAISAIRRAFADTRESPRFVATVAGRGYRFVCPVQEPPPTGNPAPATTASIAAAEAAASGSTVDRRGAVGALLAVAGLAAGGFWAWRRSPARARPLPRSIAVLPFQPLVDKAADPMLEMGMAETLINQLGDVPGLAVPPLSSVRRHTAVDRDPLAVGRALAVEAVLDGQVQVVGERVRITARLLDTRSGESLWRGSFDERLAGLLELQDTLAGRLIAALAADARAAPRAASLTRYTADSEAWRLYLNGRYHWERRDEASLRKALDYFGQAGRRDPRFALPLVGVADTWALLGIFGVVPSTTAFATSRDAANRALTLEPDLPEALAALGHVEMIHDHDWDAAGRHFERAASLKPGFSQAHAWLAMHHTMHGRHEASQRAVRTAQALEPKSLGLQAIGGFLLYFSGRYDEARDVLVAVVDSEPRAPLPRHFLARVHLARGDGRAALAAIDGVAQPAPGSWSNAGRARALLGDRPAVQAEIGRALALGAQGFGVGLDLALMHLALGDRGAALGALERAVEDGSTALGYLNVEPGLAALHDEPRFRAVAARIGLSGGRS